MESGKEVSSLSYPIQVYVPVNTTQFCNMFLFCTKYLIYNIYILYIYIVCMCVYRITLLITLWPIRTLNWPVAASKLHNNRAPFCTAESIRYINAIKYALFPWHF